MIIIGDLHAIFSFVIYSHDVVFVLKCFSSHVSFVNQILGRDAKIDQSHLDNEFLCNDLFIDSKVVGYWLPYFLFHYLHDKS